MSDGLDKLYLCNKCSKTFYLDRDTKECPQCKTQTLIRCSDVYYKRNLTFEEAYTEMLHGKKIARKGWEGYWYIKPQTSELTNTSRQSVVVG